MVAEVQGCSRASCGDFFSAACEAADAVDTVAAASAGVVLEEAVEDLAASEAAVPVVAGRAAVGSQLT